MALQRIFHKIYVRNGYHLNTLTFLVLTIVYLTTFAGIEASANRCMYRNSFLENNNIPLVDPTGIITIPDQSSDIQCTWKVAAYGPPDTRIKVTFKPFETKSNRRCSSGYLEIHDGAGYKSPTLPLLCSGTTVSPVYSSGRHVWIRTRSDKDNSLWKGFELCYESLDKGTLSLVIILILIITIIIMIMIIIIITLTLVITTTVIIINLN